MRSERLDDLLARVPGGAASSASVGVRPSRCVSAGTTASSACRSSWTCRGGRTTHPLSRRWRLISPEMVGIANDTKGAPNPGSYRRAAFTRPR